MIALILKDIVTLKKSLLLTLVISLAISVYGVYNNAVFMVPLICVIIPLILTAIAFGYDAKSNFEQFVFSTPIKKSSYVFSKLFFPFVFGLLGSIVLFILFKVKNQMPMESILLLSLITIVGSVMLSAIQLPFVLKYGAEQGRLIMVITYFLIFALSSLLEGNSDFVVKIMEMLSKQSLTMIGLGIIALGLIIIAMGIKVSMMIMEKKEY